MRSPSVPSTGAPRPTNPLHYCVLRGDDKEYTVPRRSRADTAAVLSCQLPILLSVPSLPRLDILMFVPTFSIYLVNRSRKISNSTRRARYDYIYFFLLHNSTSQSPVNRSPEGHAQSIATRMSNPVSDNENKLSGMVGKVSSNATMEAHETSMILLSLHVSHST